MPVRARPIDWSLLVNPVSRGLETEAAASARFGGTLAGAGQDAGAAIVRKRTEAESRRRFGEELSLRKRAMLVDEGTLQLRKDELIEKRRDEQGMETAKLDSLEEMVNQATVEGAATGQVSQGIVGGLSQLVDASGGFEAAQAKLQARTAAAIGNGGAVQGVVDDYMEGAFQPWYAEHAKALGLNPNPDDPEHHYDYRAAFKAGAKPDASGHWPSEFKTEGHPSAILRLDANGQESPSGVPTDTRTMRPVGNAVAGVNPSVGELGVPDLPSEELSARAKASESRMTAAKTAMDEARRILHSNSLHGKANRDRANLTYQRAYSAYLATSKAFATDTARASQATKREAAAQKVADEKAAAQTKIEQSQRAIGVLRSTKAPKYAHYTDASWEAASEAVGRGVPLAEALNAVDPYAAIDPTVEAKEKQAHLAELESKINPKPVETPEQKGKAQAVTEKVKAAELGEETPAAKLQREKDAKALDDLRAYVGTLRSEYDMLKNEVDKGGASADPEAVRDAWKRYVAARDKLGEKMGGAPSDADPIRAKMTAEDQRVYDALTPEQKAALRKKLGG